jgi:hypothetical protein
MRPAWRISRLAIRAYIRCMNVDLTEEEAAALLRELNDIIRRRPLFPVAAQRRDRRCEGRCRRRGTTLRGPSMRKRWGDRNQLSSAAAVVQVFGFALLTALSSLPIPLHR